MKHHHSQQLVGYTPVVGSRLLFKENEKKKETSSGIILSSGQDTTNATVVAIGRDVETVNVGDVIYLNWVKATKLRIDNEDYYSIDEEELVAVLENNV